MAYNKAKIDFCRQSKTQDRIMKTSLASFICFIYSSVPEWQNMFVTKYKNNANKLFISAKTNPLLIAFIQKRVTSLPF